MQVDFEARVDFRRLHAFRLVRVRQALIQSGLGALLLFDQYNIRRHLGGAHRGRSDRDPERRSDHHSVYGRGAADRQSLLAP